MNPLKILLVEDERDHADLIRKLVSSQEKHLTIEWVDRLSSALNILEKNNFDVILLDLGLPGSDKEKTLSSVLALADKAPVVVLSAISDEDFALKAVHKGAQDYICKARMSGEIILRTIRYSIERKEILEELRAANRAKDEFLSTLSHELRNPAGIIQSYAELLCQDEASEIKVPKIKAAQVIYRHAKHQLRLVDDLLDMSRILNGKFELDNNTINLASVIEAAIDTQSVAIDSKKISIIKEIDPSATMILGDSDRLQQVMVNLISNAAKFSFSNSKIEIKLKREKSRVEIAVTDYGKGIEKDFLPFVFDRFRQQEGGIARKFGGLGLGMAITKQLVELHGGQIQVHSDGFKKGTTFKVYLPLLAIRIAPKNQIDSRHKSSHRKGKKPLRGLKIMVVDDCYDILMLVKTVLSMHGAEVTTMISASEALIEICKRKPDVLVCDIGMPDIDGYTFLKILREKESKNGCKPIPAAALTAYARKEDRDEAIKSGFNIHLSKPVEEREFITRILELVN
ncbi:MAG: response regulator [Bdellovibrionota bacterium]